MSSSADYYGGSAVPPTTAYGPPKIDFSALTGGLDTFVKGRQEGREEDTATAFRNGIPMVKDANGNDLSLQCQRRSGVRPVPQQIAVIDPDRSSER
jgi:hypothetical protein